MYLDKARTCTDTIAKKARHKIYNNRRWRKVRLLKLTNDPLCEMCLKEGIITSADAIHHIIPIDIDVSLAYEYTNLMSICHECHGKIHQSLHTPQ